MFGCTSVSIIFKVLSATSTVVVAVLVLLHCQITRLDEVNPSGLPLSLALPISRASTKEVTLYHCFLLCISLNYSYSKFINIAYNL